MKEMKERNTLEDTKDIQLYTSEINDLKKILIELLKENTLEDIELSAVWTVRINTKYLEVEPDETLNIIYSNTQDGRDVSVGEITIKLAKDLLNKNILEFCDISWDSTEKYIYYINCFKLLNIDL